MRIIRRAGHDKNDRSKDNFYIAESRREGRKVYTWNVKALGRRDILDQKYGDAEKYAREQLEIAKKEKIHQLQKVSYLVDFDKMMNPSDQISSNFNGKYVSWLYIDMILRRMGIKAIFDESNTKEEYDAFLAFAFLVSGRIMDPKSKKGTFDDIKNYFGINSLNLEHLYRVMDLSLSLQDKLKKASFDYLKKEVKLDDSVIYHDCTNFYFETETEDQDEIDDNGDILSYGIRRYGHSKEHRPNPIVTMGLFLSKNGFPMDFFIEPGNKNEQSIETKNQRAMLKNLGHPSKFIYAADGGLASSEIKYYNHMILGQDYLVSQSLKKIAEEDKKLLMSDLNWVSYDDEKTPISYSKYRAAIEKELEQGVDKLSEEEKNLCSISAITKIMPRVAQYTITSGKGKKKAKVKWDEEIAVILRKKDFIYQRTLFNRQLDRAKKLLGKKIDGTTNINDIRRFISVDKMTQNGEVAEISINSLDEEQIQAEKEFHGLYAMTTTLIGKSFKELMAVNYNRWRIEKCFRVLKTNFDARPVYHYKEERIRAHFLICFFALTIFCILRDTVNSGLLEQESKEQQVSHYTDEEILDTLRNMWVLDEGSYLNPLYDNSLTLQKLEEKYTVGLNHKFLSPGALRKAVTKDKEQPKQKRRRKNSTTK